MLLLKIQVGGKVKTKTELSALVVRFSSCNKKRLLQVNHLKMEKNCPPKSKIFVSLNTWHIRRVSIRIAAVGKAFLKFSNFFLN